MVKPDTLLGQLMAGTAEEMEHTTDRKVAVRIALDHLAEDRDYYTKLRGAGLMGSKDMSEMQVFKAGLARISRCLQGVAKAAMPEGTVRARRDGNYKKVGGQWVKVPSEGDTKREQTKKLDEAYKKVTDQSKEPAPGEAKALHPALAKVRADPDDPEQPNYDDLINAVEVMGLKATDRNIDAASSKWQAAHDSGKRKGTSGMGLTDIQSRDIARAHHSGDAKGYASALEAAAPGKAKELQDKLEAGDRLGPFKKRYQSQSDSDIIDEVDPEDGDAWNRANS